MANAASEAVEKKNQLAVQRARQRLEAHKKSEDNKDFGLIYCLQFTLFLSFNFGTGLVTLCPRVTYVHVAFYL